MRGHGPWGCRSGSFHPSHDRRPGLAGRRGAAQGAGQVGGCMLCNACMAPDGELVCSTARLSPRHHSMLLWSEPQCPAYDCWLPAVLSAYSCLLPSSLTTQQWKRWPACWRYKPAMRRICFLLRLRQPSPAATSSPTLMMRQQILALRLPGSCRAWHGAPALITSRSSQTPSHWQWWLGPCRLSTRELPILPSLDTSR